MVKPKGAERIISSGELEKMTMKDLVEIYNDTGVKLKARTFRSVAEGVRMILERLVELNRRKPSRQPTGRRGRPPGRVSLPRCKGRGTKKKVAKRELIVLMLRRGTTLAQVQAAFNYTRKRLLERLQHINRDLGFGIHEQEDGKLKLER